MAFKRRRCTALNNHQLSIFVLLLLVFLPGKIAYGKIDGSSVRDEISDILSRADSLMDEQEPDSAIRLVDEARMQAEKKLGLADTTTVQVYHKLGLFYYFNADYEAAERIWKQTLALRKDIFGELHSDVALSLNNLGVVHYDLGEYAESEKYYLQSLDIRKKIFGIEDNEVASSLNNLGNLYSAWGKYFKAESLFQECLIIRRKVLEPDHPDIAVTLNNLANLYSDLGEYSRAETLYRSALDTWEEVLGPDHPYIATCLNNFAVFYCDLGKFTNSEYLHKRALEIRRGNFGEAHPDVAHSINNLAALYWGQGRYAEAESLYLKAMAIWEEVYGPQSVDLARSVSNLADIYRSQEKYEKADHYLQKALDIRRQQLGEKHRDVAWSYNKLAILSLERGSYKESMEYSTRAFEIFGDVYGLDHPETARSLFDQALAKAAMGEYSEAEKLHQEALSIRRNYYGSSHPEVASSYNQLAKIYAMSDDLDKSLLYYDEFQKSRTDFIEYAFGSVSEDQKIKYIHDYPVIDYSLLSFAYDNKSDHSLSSAYEMVLRGKGLVIEALSAERRSVYDSYDSTIIANIDQYNEICSEIANLTVAGSESLDRSIYRNRLGSLYSIKDSLEALISKSCVVFKRELDNKRFEIREVAEKISPDCVLIEILKYKPYDFTRVGNEKAKTGDNRYLAFTFDSSGNLEIFDLGEAAAIDDLVSSARNMIYSSSADLYTPRRQEYENRLNDVLYDLYEILIVPMELELEDKTFLMISPDGQLNLIPFEILQDREGKYLVESFNISYVSCGRDLLRFSDGTGKASDMFIMADPDYDCRRETGEEPGNARKPASYNMLSFTEPLRGGGECLNAKFNPIPYTRKEVERIVSVCREKGSFDIRSYFQSDASEETIKKMENIPNVMHLSTHGYFCRNRDYIYDNPLLRGGLVFAGANCVSGESRTDMIGEEDGIFTALEVTGLNLNGTELVVLSACETGVGEVENSEGVYGLRRAFQYAGAETIIMSLWKIPDKETYEIMENFYSLWLDGYTKQEALRMASLKVLEDQRNSHNSSHPYFWGGFILSGNPY